jgi:hypothetical protein
MRGVGTYNLTICLYLSVIWQFIGIISGEKLSNIKLEAAFESDFLSPYKLKTQNARLEMAGKQSATAQIPQYYQNWATSYQWLAGSVRSPSVKLLMFQSRKLRQLVRNLSE